MSKRTITVNGGDPVQATNGNRRIKYDMEAIAEDLLQEEKNEQHKLHSEKTKDYGVRYSRHTGRYWILSSGRWIEVGTAEVTRHLQIEEGCSSKPPFKGLPSEVDEAMHAAIKYHSADMIGSYAGYLKQGTTTLLSGETLLVPTVRKLLTAKQGDSEFIWDFLAELLPKALQVDALRSWLKMAVTSLYLGKPGDWKPKQVLALLGLSGVGKTSLQEKIITPLLGYRQENCAPYLTGQERNFNKELGFAEHWFISDADWTKQIEKKTFLSRYKDAVANNYMRIRGMREDALNLPTYRCITISLNLDAESISVLPDMGASHWEKMLVLDCEQPSAKFARKDGNGWDEKVAAQLPALLYRLLYEYEVPEALQDKQGRYGVRYSNSKWEKELCAPDQIETDLQVEEIINEAMFNAPSTEGFVSHTDEERGAIKRRIAISSRHKPSAIGDVTSVTTVTVIARVIYDTIFNIKSPVKSSAELIPILKKGPRAISRLLSRWATEPQNRVYFQVIPAGLDSHDEVLKFTLTQIVR
jgi:hypothetical protein